MRRSLALAAEHQKEGRWEEAEKLYREVLRDNPGNVDAMRLLGNVAMQTGRTFQAERLFRRAVANAPDFVHAQIDLGIALKKQSRLVEAIEQFRQENNIDASS